MNFLRRAVLSTMRKKTRSLILFSIMVLIFAGLIGESVVGKRIEDLKRGLNKNFQASFTIESKTEGINLKQVQAISKNEKIEKTFFETNVVMESEKNNVVKAENKNINLEGMEEQTKVLATFLNDSKLQKDFLSGKYEIKQGEHLREGSRNEVLIHEEFAKLNKLKIGDKIRTKWEGKGLELKIVGIFAGKDSQQKVWSFEMIENRLFMDFGSLRNIKQDSDIQLASYFVKDPKSVETVIGEVKKIDLPWEKIAIFNNYLKNAETYQTIENIEKLLVMMLAGIGIVGVLILGFVLLFWFRGRIHEIGTLIAIGNSKMNILIQLISELFIIAMLSFMPAIAVGNLSSGLLGGVIIDQVSSDQSENMSSIVLQKGELEKGDYVNIYLLGMVVILLSVGMSSISIMKLTPKQILTKMK